MSGEPLDELYFKWLYGQVAIPEVRNPSATYWKLFRKLFNKEFVWIVDKDDNRWDDGRDLRYEFLSSMHIREADPNWLHLGCSMLELFVGLARRLSFQAEGEPSSWFWILMTNVGLDRFNDKNRTGLTDDRIDHILDRVIWRTYEPNGVGGLFPLANPARDQREVELWYQMSAYLLERA